MRNRYDTAQQFWCASATTAAACFLAPRPLRALIPLGIGISSIAWPRSTGFRGLHAMPAIPTAPGRMSMNIHPAGTRDALDESLDESFPASDPPSFFTR